MRIPLAPEPPTATADGVAAGQNDGGDGGDRPRPGADASVAREEAATSARRAENNTGPWTAEEHRLFLQGLERHGKRWAEIVSLTASSYRLLAAHVKSRTHVQIRSHAINYFKRMAKANPQEAAASAAPVPVRGPRRTSGRTAKPIAPFRDEVFPASDRTGWTPEEDERLSDLVRGYGTGQVNWTIVAAKLPGERKPSSAPDIRRSKLFSAKCFDIAHRPHNFNHPGREREGCIKRWTNFLDPSISWSPFTADEDRAIVRFQAGREKWEKAGRWTTLAKILPGRTAKQIENRWKTGRLSHRKGQGKITHQLVTHEKGRKRRQKDAVTANSSAKKRKPSARASLNDIWQECCDVADGKGLKSELKRKLEQFLSVAKASGKESTMTSKLEPPSKRTKHTPSSDPTVRYDCPHPRCGKTNLSKAGLKAHHGRMHGKIDWSKVRRSKVVVETDVLVGTTASPPTSKGPAAIDAAAVGAGASKGSQLTAEGAPSDYGKWSLSSDPQAYSPNPSEPLPDGDVFRGLLEKYWKPGKPPSRFNSKSKMRAALRKEMKRRQRMVEKAFRDYRALPQDASRPRGTGENSGAGAPAVNGAEETAPVEPRDSSAVYPLARAPPQDAPIDAPGNHEKRDAKENKKKGGEDAAVTDKRKPRVRKPWTVEEDESLKDLVMRSGSGRVKWSDVATKMPGKISNTTSFLCEVSESFVNGL